MQCRQTSDYKKEYVTVGLLDYSQDRHFYSYVSALTDLSSWPDRWRWARFCEFIYMLLC